MRVGLIVDGESEFSSLPYLKRGLEQATGHVIARILKADLQPKEKHTPASLARKLRKELAILDAERVQRIIVLVDREDRVECPSTLASQLGGLLGQVVQNRRVEIVIKDRCFENWLVADPEAMQASPARFDAGLVRNRVAPDRADRVDAGNVLRAAIRQGYYDKIRDSQRIMKHCDHLRMARNSRSFRKFLRCMNHPAYGSQSKNPIP